MGLPGHLNQVIWVRLPNDAAPFSQDGFADPSPGNNAPHIEMFYSQISTHLLVTGGDVPLPPESQL
jgi:hypothetical protein